MSIQRGIIGGLVALQAFQIAEGVQARTIAKRVQAEGVVVELDLPFPIGRQRIPIAPPKSSGSSSSSSPDTFQLPPDVQALQARMHKVSIGLALAAGVAAFFIAGVGGSDDDDDDDD